MEFETFLIVGLFAWQSFAVARGDLRIAGGWEAAKGAAPYQCSMQFQYTHHCGCAILDKKWIVTIASCIGSKKIDDVSILVGTNDLTEGGERYHVEKLIMHNGYNIPRLANNIGLIRVQDIIEFNQFVQPIEYSREEIQSGFILQFTGWGKVSQNGKVPIKLRAINLAAISYDQCMRIEPELHTGQLCTLDPKGEGACAGDAGGPLTYDGKLVGIFCFYRECGGKHPDGFTKIAYYHNWIRRTIIDNFVN